MDAIWRVELLGRLQAVRGERVVDRFRSQQTGALLAYLAFYCHRPHARDELIEILWPECDLDAGRNRLRVALSSLRSQLEPPGVAAGTILLADRATIQLNPAAIATDVAAFEAARRDAARAGSSAEQAHRLTKVAESYLGELLPGYFEAWILPERQRLAEAFFLSVAQLVPLLQQIGDASGAIEWARRAVCVDPLREEAQQDLIRLLAAAGQPQAALRQYREFERLMAQQMAAAPSAATLSLVRGIERQVAEGPGDAGRQPPSEASTPAASRAPIPAPDPAGEPQPPTGTVTFLMTDVERSTAQRELTGEAFAAALEVHHTLLRDAFRQHGGYEAREMGEGFLVAFPRAVDALECALAAQRALNSHVWPEAVGPLRVRMALHTGDVHPQDGDEHSRVVHSAQQVLVAGHGGQLLCSEQTAALLRRHLPPNARLTDLGVYRLRDVAVPERIFQVDRAGEPSPTFPPLRADRGYAGHLPPQLTRFFGREQELAQLLDLLQPDGSVRLLTMTGPAGTGKTRLAMAAAGRLGERWRGAIWCVSLTDVTDARLIADKARDALGLPRSPQAEALDQIVGFLSQQPALLVLDNFEHLVAAGTPLVRELLERIPTLTCLITSRQRLGLPGEQEFPVAPLAVPGSGEMRDLPDTRELKPEELLQFPSLRLFVDRAQAVRSDFQLTPANAPTVATLCRRLEGLPLAIELAAARARTLTPAQMLSRLEQRFELLISRQRDPDARHRSLRAALDSSYQLLSPELQQFFTRLSVFRGGWTLEAAEAVCEEPAALEYLEQLQESSLVLAEEDGLRSSVFGLRSSDRPIPNTEDRRPNTEHLNTEMRYRLYETLREYGGEQVIPEERTLLRERHAAYYLALVEQAEPALLGPEQPLWSARLEREHDNLRAVIDWAAEDHAREGPGTAAPDPLELGLRLAGTLWWFWVVRGYLAEGRQQLARLLSLPSASEYPAARLKAIVCSGSLAHFQSDEAAERSFFQEGLEAGRTMGDRWSVALSLTGLGYLSQFQGDATSARAYLEEAVPVWRELGDPWGIALALNGLADVASSGRDHGTARTLFEQSLAIRRDLGDQWGIAVSLSGLGSMALDQGDLEAALPFYEESLAIRQALDDPWGSAVALRNLGEWWQRRGDPNSARDFYARSLAIRVTLGDKRGIAECLEGLAAVVAAPGTRGAQTIARAVRVFAAAAALRERIAYPLSQSHQAIVGRRMAAAKSVLGEAAFTAALERGRTQSLEQAVAEALDTGTDEATG